MPITAKQFELGIDSVIEEWMRKIHSLLASHSQEAFTSVEMAEALSGFAYKGAPGAPPEMYLDEAFKAALDKLVEIRVADWRMVREKTYYALGDTPLPL